MWQEEFDDTFHQGNGNGTYCSENLLATPTELKRFIEKTINAEVHAALNAVEVESEPEKTDRYARETGQFISDEYSQRELGFDSACKMWRKAKSEALKEYPIK